MTEDKNKDKEKNRKNEKEEEVIEPEVVGEVTKEDKQLAMLAHILSLVGGFVVPLIIYVIKKDESEFIKDQSEESLNFQISIFIYMICGIVLTYVTCGIGFFIPIAVAIINIVYCILAGLKANEGVKYRYPFNIRFIK